MPFQTPYRIPRKNSVQPRRYGRWSQTLSDALCRIRECEHPSYDARTQTDAGTVARHSADSWFAAALLRIKTQLFEVVREAPGAAQQNYEPVSNSGMRPYCCIAVTIASCIAGGSSAFSSSMATNNGIAKNTAASSAVTSARSEWA